MKPKVSRLPARYTLFPIVGLYRTVTELFICRADKRTVSASAPLPLISATVEPIAPAFQSKSGSEKRSSGVISRPPLGGGWQREALTGGENERYTVSPSVALRATPPSQREARTGIRQSLRRFAPPPSQREARPRLRARRGDVGIAPYGRAQGVRSCNVSPSVKTEGFDTSATLRRTTQCEHWAASQREARRGCGLPRQCEHWLAMTDIKRPKYTTHVVGTHNSYKRNKEELLCLHPELLPSSFSWY